jgi:hypothetical protein
VKETIFNSRFENFVSLQHYSYFKTSFNKKKKKKIKEEGRKPGSLYYTATPKENSEIHIHVKIYSNQTGLSRVRKVYRESNFSVIKELQFELVQF